MDWRFAIPWSFRIAGNALVGSQGRAEDLLFALMRDVGSASKVFVRHRILEGGTDNDEVYTFSLFNYAVIGAEWRFW
ncbi:MAG: hypothetical protein HGB21_14870 [Nitrospirae bacterium]|nr:hypothetical protein [Nitrospirota bacterium]NTW67566.1 hypothetical protein [Nitrospirota bacterium]